MIQETEIILLIYQILLQGSYLMVRIKSDANAHTVRADEIKFLILIPSDENNRCGYCIRFRP